LIAGQDWDTLPITRDFDRAEKPAMKPRDLINRRKKMYFMIVGISFLAMTLVALSDKVLPPFLYKTLATVAITVFVVGILCVYFGIKCPKCHATLGLKYVYGEEILSHCPRCGIHFDGDSL
jgi:CBS domain containing-hemolysin-like protein